MNKETITIPSINCGHCVMAIKNELLDLDGVTEVTGDPETKYVTIEWDDPANRDTIIATLDEIGFSPEKS